MSLRTFRCRAVLAASAWILLSGLAQAGTVDVRAPPNGAYSLKVTSLKDARFKTTVRQQYDFSCGSAATATLLTYQYGHPVTEAEVFMHMYQTGDQAKIRQRGFSLLDMRRYLRSLGFEADGFEQPLDKRNFRKKILGLKIMDELDEKRTGEPSRPAKLYSFKTKKVEPIPLI